MGRPLYTNNAATYLAFGITNTATRMQVSANAGSLFPNPTGGDYFYVSLISLSGPIIEIVKCTARSGDILTIERGQEGTSPLYWNMGDNVQLRITAAGMNYIAGAAVQSTEEQVFTATQGQTVFTLTNFDYAPGTNNLAVFVNGSKQVYGVNYSETSVNTVTFNSGLNAGDVVEFLVGISVASGTLYANEINYNEGGVNAVTNTVQAKLQESVSVKDFGAKGDNTTDDTAAIQAALNYAASVPYRYQEIFFPAGYYVITSSLQIPNYVTMSGAGAGTVINNQTVTLAAPQCVNQNSSTFIGVTVKDMVFTGGQEAFSITTTAGMSLCNFTNVVMQLQTVTNFSVNADMEVCNFTNCVFSNGNYGISVGGATANMNNFDNCQFTNHSDSSVYLVTSSVNNFVGCRFEGGYVLNKYTISLSNPTNTNFYGCYFEGTHTYILAETGSTNSTVFEKCHFTYPTGSTQYQFSSDGIIQFGTNNWYQEATGPNKMMISGMNNTALGNNNLYFAYSPQHKKMVSKWITTPSSLQQNLITFTRLGSTSTPTNLQVLTGVLTINFYTIEAGGFSKLFSRLYQVNVIGDGIATMTGSLNNFSNLDNATGATLTVQVKSGATTANLIIESVLTGVTPATELVSALQWSFEYIEASTLVSNTIYPSLSI